MSRGNQLPHLGTLETLNFQTHAAHSESGVSIFRLTSSVGDALKALCATPQKILQKYTVSEEYRYSFERRKPQRVKLLEANAAERSAEQRR